jgi:two-component system cell cycle response regulator
MDGFEVVRRLKAGANTCDIPVVAVTAFAIAYDRERVLAAGFDGYLTKPIDPETFASEIERFL